MGQDPRSKNAIGNQQLGNRTRIQNILTSLLSKVCKDVDVKLHLLPIDSEVFNLRSTVTSPEAILDIKAGSSGHEEKQHSSMYVERM